MSGSIEEQLQKEGYYVSTTVGVSMKPMLRNRHDRVILRPVAPDERLKKYDLPLYRRPDGKYILHRIIDVAEDHYIIRGDNTYQKERVPFSWVIGVVTEFYRGERHIQADDKSYRRYAAVWQGAYPLRLPFHKARMLASRVKHKLFP